MEVSAGVASKKPTGRVLREVSISLWIWFKLQHGLQVGKYSYIFKKKNCHQPRVGGEITFKEPWLTGYRGGTLDHYFIYNGRGAVSAHSLIVMNTLESRIKPKSLFFLISISPIPHFLAFSRRHPPPPLNMQQTARIHAFFLFFFSKKRKKSEECAEKCSKLFFQQCARDAYSDQFQCRLVLPIDQPSLGSNIQAKLEPCNLQEFEIDQGIERSDGQSLKSRVDVPKHKKKKASPSDGEKSINKALFAICLALGSPFLELAAPVAFTLSFFFFFFLFRCSEFMKCASRETETAAWLSPLLSSWG